MKEVSKGKYSNSDMSWELKRDYFASDTYRNKDGITDEYIWNTYEKEFSEFKSIKQNKRSKSCYVVVNLVNDDVYIEKNMTKLYECLKEYGILDLMISSKSIDFTKMNNLKNYGDSCLNYYVKKLAVSPPKNI